MSLIILCFLSFKLIMLTDVTNYLRILALVTCHRFYCPLIAASSTLNGSPYLLARFCYDICLAACAYELSIFYLPARALHALLIGFVNVLTIILLTLLCLGVVLYHNLLIAEYSSPIVIAWFFFAVKIMVK